MNITGYSKSPVKKARIASGRADLSDSPEMKGMVSEIVYRDDQLWMAQCLLLP